MNNQCNTSSNSLQSQCIFSKVYLPFELIQYIQEYANINNILITSKYFELFRYEFFRWKLTATLSKKYYNDINFRNSILSKMKYPNKQLSLKLYQCSGITDVSTLGIVRTLDLSGCRNITDVNALDNVHTLNLSDCTGIADINALGNVHTLNLYNCSSITDVSALGNVHDLKLWGCTGITDANALGNVTII